MDICRRIAKGWKIILAYVFMIFIVVAHFFILNSFEYSYKSNRSPVLLRVMKKEQNKTNILDGCFYVYIDLGSNIGVQIRKLFEPELYPEANVHPIFNSYFGSIEERKDTKNPLSICAVGFEPNLSHTKYLKQIETSYNKCGYQVMFFTETAVSNRDGNATFYSDTDLKHLEWGSGILSPEVNKIANKTTSNVKKIRLSKFLRNVVGKRKIPKIGNKSRKPKVIMKMDVEGSEVDIIPDLLFNGGLQFVNTLMIEWHKRLEILPERIEAQELLVQIIDLLDKYANVAKSQNYDFKLEIVDDEEYYNSRFKLPQCDVKEIRVAPDMS